MNDRLQRYRSKRDFRKTSEPSGDGKAKSGRRFVIQKHDARSLHYDLRLQVGDVLASWAVPKGPSTDPSDKRLAVQTEDHPVDYLDFEGVIPEGEYGAGVVLVWDRGTYRNLRADKDDAKDMQASLDEGLVEVWLDGEKLSGGYALKRIRGGDKPQWLLIKMDDTEADARRRPTSTQPESVQTGRELDEIAERESD
jgi:DNA ligase D-like protein (predicted 3'-phosphoesterase)